MKKVGPNLVLMVIFVIAVAIYFIYDTRKVKEFFTELREEYPPIGYEVKINATITKIYNVDPKISRNDPNHVFIVLDNLIKMNIYASFEVKRDLMIEEVIEVGERLVKEENSYTFFLYKIKAGDTIKFEFELCDGLGYPLKTSILP